VDLEGLLEGGVGLLGAVVLEEELSLASPGLGVAGMLGEDLVHDAQGGLVLALGVLAEGAVDVHVNGLAAPLELLAAAAGAGGVGIEGHARLLPGEKRGAKLLVRIANLAGDGNRRGGISAAGGSVEQAEATPTTAVKQIAPGQHVAADEGLVAQAR